MIKVRISTERQKIFFKCQTEARKLNNAITEKFMRGVQQQFMLRKEKKGSGK